MIPKAGYLSAGRPLPAASMSCPDDSTARATCMWASLRAVERAKVPRWPKLLVNLRASRETELMKQDTAHLVHAWIGNSEKVAEDHYLMPTEEDFLHAAARPSAIPTLIPTPSTHAMAHQESSPEMQTAASPGIPEDAAD